MPDISSMLVRNSVRSLERNGESCSRCDRVPLVGERLHEMDTGRVFCDLCLASLPEEERVAVSSQRVRASERKLAVVPRAA